MIFLVLRLRIGVFSSKVWSVMEYMNVGVVVEFVRYYLSCESGKPCRWSQFWDVSECVFLGGELEFVE